MLKEIKAIPSKKVIGKFITTSLSENQTSLLWRSFMINRKNIINTLDNNLLSIQLFEHDYFEKFDPARKFNKWASAEVTTFDDVPDDMHTLVIPEGLYAVFLHKGGPSAFMPTFNFIYHEWFPSSGYVLDHRPHFEVLGEKYKNDHPDSEEDIYIPIKKKITH